MYVSRRRPRCSGTGPRTGPRRRVGYNAGIDPSSEPEHGPAPAPRRTRRAVRYAVVSGAIGALLVLGFWIGAAATGGTHWSFTALSYVIFGGASGAVFGPLFALARDDGRDAAIVIEQDPVPGRADTSVEGAQADDLGGHDRSA